ncbi:MAG: Coenzyme F420 hydrogenase/dehydrogenase, beta subunit C-terminal domain [Oscillospiraceae bacterium]|nr:Coenzyme F420 hydrogenase/dehydrogenase, beta subunit C-terminal domain [Oscillospiraceae bacterium]
MILFDNKEKCCGCGSCMNSCPKNAITMKKDASGILLPEINKELCIDCGICFKSCAFQNVTETNSPIKVYGAARKNKEKLLESASGGLFAVIAEKIITDGGVVFGAAMLRRNDNLYVEHISVEKKENLSAIYRSKYAQSNTAYSYKSVKLLLESGKKVLYSGTPCQIAGLKGFLRKNYSNLYTVDIICHGVPSVDFFQSYIKYIENKRNITIKEYNFRDKSMGWGPVGSYTFIDKNGNEHIKKMKFYDSSYYHMFINSQSYRQSCYICKYACPHRPGDITLGDYWGFSLKHPGAVISGGGQFDERFGISSVIVSTEKGNKLLESVENEILLQESTFENVSALNPQLTQPCKKGDMYDDIMKNYCSGGYAMVEKFYAPVLRKKKLKQVIKKFVPKFILKKL